eukprot:jgi/Mesvir1/22531/Mv18550-RA.1
MVTSCNMKAGWPVPIQKAIPFFFVALVAHAHLAPALEETAGEIPVHILRRRAILAERASQNASNVDTATWSRRTSQRRLLSAPTNAPQWYSKEVETQLLLELGMAVSGGRLELLTGGGKTFSENDKDPCGGDDWFGLSCVLKDDQQEYVSAVDFSSTSGLTGTLPASISSLYFLEKLSIPDQNLTGTLPPGLPSFLQVCRLEGNKISGTVPSTFTSSLEQVYVMKLNENKLSGTVPDSFLGDIPVSTFLDRTARDYGTAAVVNLAGNRLEGTLPLFVTRLAAPYTRAEIVDLSNNFFTGTIPEVWDEVLDYDDIHTYPTSLSFANNQLTGTIPLALLNVPAYSIIDLSGNMLSGTVHEAAFQSDTTGAYQEKFIFSSNRLSGFLPSQGTLTPWFTRVDVANNLMSGYIPATWVQNSPFLARLDVSNNKLSGFMTYDDFAANWKMTYFDATSNLLSGTMPCPSSVRVDRNVYSEGNFFPSGVMTHFAIAHNTISGTMPRDWENAIVEYLDVSHNIISGTVPRLDQVAGAREIYLNHNKFTGLAIPRKCDLCNGAAVPTPTKIFAVNDNLLTEVPEFLEFFAMTVEEIYLHNNQITGTLSPAANSFTCQWSLRTLDMSNNLLSGYLPNHLNLDLEKVSFAQNRFSGTVPFAYGLGSIAEIYVDNNQLSGSLPLAVPGVHPDISFVCQSLIGGARRKLAQTDPLFAALRRAHFHENLIDTFDIDFILTSAPELEELKVDNNQIASNLNYGVPYAGNPRKLRTLHLHNNQFTGLLQSLLWEWFPSLEELHLHHNSFIGTIPFEMGQFLTSLQRFSLSGNQLMGTIPPQLSRLSSLTKLRLSSDRLTGTIPPELGQLQRLLTLDVSHNPLLTGCVPELYLVAALVSTSGTGLTGTCSDDVVPPILECPQPIDSVECPQPISVDVNPSFKGIDCDQTGVYAPYGTGCPAAALAFLTPTITDNSGVYVVSFTPTSFPKDVTTTVTWVATDSAGNNATCSSQLRPASRAQLVAIEVTQSVQDWQHNVPLVAGKSTMVRAFVQMADDDVREAQLLLNGYLSAYRADGTPLDPIAKVNLESSLRITKLIRAGRGFIRGSFNFLLPLMWVAAGELTLCFVAAPSDEFVGMSPVQCMEQDEVADCCITVTFNEMNKPCFRFIKVIYKDEQNVQRLVSTPTLHEQWRRFRSMLPIPANSIADFRQFDFVYSSRPPLRMVNNALDATRVIDNLSQRCWYIGVLRGIGGGLAELNGETAAYYAGATEGSYSCSYERNRGVHEFLHNLGIEHARQGNVTACSAIENLEGDQFPFLEALNGNTSIIRATLGPLGDPLTEVFGTDPQLAATGAPSILAFSSPRFVFALMSYCQPLNFFGCQARWIDRNTYTSARSRWARTHPPTSPMFRGSIEISDEGYDVTLGPLLQVCTTADTLGKTNGKPTDFSMQVLQGTTVVLDVPILDSTPTADLINCTDMSDPNCATAGGGTAYGDFSNVPLTGCGFCFGSFDLFTSFSFDLLPMFSFDAFPTYSFDFIPQFSFDGYPYFSFDSSVFLLFDGWPSFSFDGANLPNSNVSVNGNNFVVADFQGFFEEIAANYSDFQGVSQGLAGGGVRTVDFKIVQQTNQAYLPTDNQPLPQPYCPDFYVAELCNCEIFTLDHVDSDTTDNTTPRQVCVTYAKSKLRATDGARFRVYVSDGLRSTDALTEVFAVSNNAPEVQVVFPTNGTYSVFVDNSLYLQGAWVAKVFSTSSEGYAYDIEDGVLGDSDCIWYEATDDQNLVQLGFGLETSTVASVLRSNSDATTCLTTHTIRLECFDHNVGSSMDEITHFLLGSGGPPTIACPVDLVTAEADVSSCSANVTYPEVTAADPCGLSNIVPEVIAPVGGVSGSAFPVGETAVVYRATEYVTHASSMCQFTVRVTETVPPQISCPANITTIRSSNLGGAYVNYTVNATDNCAVAIAAPSNPFHGSGQLFPFGVTQVQYYAADASANFDTCSFSVEVQAAVMCGAVCTGSQGSYILEFTLQLTTSGNPRLDAEQACAWNVVFGTAAGLADPGDPCLISGSDVAKRRRALLQGATILRVTRLYFPTEVEALQAQLLILQALKDGTLLAQLQALFGVLSIDLVNLAVFLLGFTSDPHFQGPCGQRFDFMGVAGESFCLVTSEALHVNGRMMAAMVS